MPLRFDDQVVIVTGAGGGLGRAHALAFAERGARVVVNDLGGAVDGTGGSIDAAAAVVEEIRAKGGQAIAHGASVTDEAEVGDMIARAIEAFGRIDVLVNNAGILRDKTFAKMTLADFDKVIDVHLTGAARVTHAVWPIMREQAYGRVIFTSSPSGIYGNVGQANYGAGKMAQIGLMQTLKLEGAKYGIHVNTIVPLAATRMTEAMFPPEVLALSKPEAVSPAVLFLASREAPNGAILGAGAGHYSRFDIVETPGVTLPGATVDDIAAHYQDIANADGARAFSSCPEQLSSIISKAFAAVR